MKKMAMQTLTVIVTMISFAFAKAATINTDHMVCALLDASTATSKPTELFSVYFKKSMSPYHRAQVRISGKTADLLIKEEVGVGIWEVDISNDETAFLSFSSGAPVAFVGARGLPSFHVGSNDYYFMCREADKQYIESSFKNALLIK